MDREIQFSPYAKFQFYILNRWNFNIKIYRKQTESNFEILIKKYFSIFNNLKIQNIDNFNYGCFVLPQPVMFLNQHQPKLFFGRHQIGFLSKYVGNICQLTLVKAIFRLTLVESIFQLMLTRYFLPTSARVCLVNIG